jgi:hypothetical protein
MTVFRFFLVLKAINEHDICYKRRVKYLPLAIISSTSMEALNTNVEKLVALLYCMRLAKAHCSFQLYSNINSH